MVTPSKLNGTSNQTGYEPGDHMTQQTFSFGSNPRVVITQVDANLSVRAWKEQLIRVETDLRMLVLATPQTVSGRVAHTPLAHPQAARVDRSARSAMRAPWHTPR